MPGKFAAGESGEMRVNHGSISIAAGSPGIMITAFQERPQFTIKCT